MANKVEITSVDQYVSAQPAATRAVLVRVRRAIRKALPAADETMSYRIPTYKIDGRVVIYFAGWKEHYSLYPVGKAIVAALADDLAAYEVEKSTIRFPLGRAVPAALIARIAKMRAQEVGSRRTSKTSGQPSRRGSSGSSR